jgi:hypothetical protein
MTNWHNVRRHFRLFASCAINAVPPNYEPGELDGSTADQGMFAADLLIVSVGVV